MDVRTYHDIATQQIVYCVAKKMNEIHPMVGTSIIIISFHCVPKYKYHCASAILNEYKTHAKYPYRYLCM